MRDYFTADDVHKFEMLVRQERGKRIVSAALGKRAEGNREYRDDGYVNMLTKYGTGQDNGTAYQFAGENTTADMVLEQQYESNGIFARIIDLPAEEAVKHGFDMSLTSPEAQNGIMDMLDELNWEEKAATAIKWARLFGGAIIVMLIDDGRGIDEPLDWCNIRGIDELLVYDRSLVTADEAHLYTYSSVIKAGKGLQRMGEPQFYHVASIYGSFVVHTSRCLVFRNGILPERTMLANYRYFGMPEYERIKRELRETVTSHGLGVKLLERCVQAVHSIKNLASMLTTEDGENQVIRRLQVIDMARSILNSIAIDADGESYEFKSMPLTGVKDIIDSTCNMLSAVTNIPQTLLFGRSPAGENSTGISDLENYYNYVERIQRLMLRNNLRTLLDVIIQAGLYNAVLKEEPKYKLAFNPLWSMSETEQAAVEQTRAATAMTKAQTAQVYVDMQALDPSEVRAGLAREDEFCVEELLDDLSEDELWGLGDDELLAGEKTFDQQQINLSKPFTTGEAKTRINDKEPAMDGGAGSGNFGHEGRPGQIGGSGSSLSAAERNKISKRLVGKTTADGVTIKRVSNHAFDRFGERSLSAGTVEALMASSQTSPGHSPNTRCYDIPGRRMVLNIQTGTVITVMRRRGGKNASGGKSNKNS